MYAFFMCVFVLILKTRMHIFYYKMTIAMAYFANNIHTFIAICFFYKHFDGPQGALRPPLALWALEQSTSCISLS